MLIADRKLENVRLHGRLSRDEVKKFYATCSALILPSLYEVQPIVLLEAMASRIPIIVSKGIGIEVDGPGSSSYRADRPGDRGWHREFRRDGP